MTGGVVEASDTRRDDVVEVLFGVVEVGVTVNNEMVDPIVEGAK